jgi:hypothetical protein
MGGPRRSRRGRWHSGIRFSHEQIAEFTPVKDQGEADSLANEARIALGDHAIDKCPPGSTSITISFDPIELGALEMWIADQSDPKPSREVAIRRLLGEALMRS